MTKLIEYEEATSEVREVYDDIMRTRKVDFVTNIWKALANHPPTLKRTWENVKGIMSTPGVLDPVTKEMLYIAVSATNNCEYCVAAHSAAARKQGMSDEMFGEMMAIVGLANSTNRLVNGFRVPIDERFK